ncbi:hypothetical protein CANTEDRAFT_95037 [Yamadazyma tenuis ATCC 10573]|uniref:Uncharacterized protein n=1 Tax=Candida tenuis (strain ATCC 10573 / BCRC 21748 / CBS 615 / JCM 9827 / NBRC 10315 / NRRL Y-1498 / VKM Y-70) TaxID=590646 RepID=G3BB56_CANTC|nr:uncharacterized protein CANTEDRAFT_95037 [Yamadazyma tenuis ATCC 10573]EGV62144.1 hypothetical protein CANTEDRAFT_95037 [Yamadazyma tenuis ATCC 10573]
MYAIVQTNTIGLNAEPVIELISQLLVSDSDSDLDSDTDLDTDSDTDLNLDPAIPKRRKIARIMKQVDIYLNRNRPYSFASVHNKLFPYYIASNITPPGILEVNPQEDYYQMLHDVFQQLYTMRESQLLGSRS